MKSSNTAPLAVAYWDLDGRLLFLNDRAVKNLGGTSPEEFLGKSLAETFGDEAGGVYLARIRKAAGSQAGMAGASPIGCGSTCPLSFRRRHIPWAATGRECPTEAP